MNTESKTILSRLINKQSPVYLVGEEDEAGEFWCWQEHAVYEDAVAYWNRCVQKYPTLRLLVIEKQTTHNLLISTHLF